MSLWAGVFHWPGYRFRLDLSCEREDVWDHMPVFLISVKISKCSWNKMNLPEKQNFLFCHKNPALSSQWEGVCKSLKSIASLK